MKENAQFTTIDKKLLFHDIIKIILNQIRNGELKPGDRLLPERDLAKQLGVSRPSVREALRVLSYLHIIEVRHGDGNYANPSDPTQIAKPLSEILNLLDNITHNEIIEAQVYLQESITSIASTRIESSTIKKLKKVTQEAEQNIDDPSEFLRCDLEFHSLMAESTKNPLLICLNETFTQMGLPAKTKMVSSPQHRQSLHRYHFAITESLSISDPDLRQKALDDHVQELSASLKYSLTECN